MEANFPHPPCSSDEADLTSFTVDLTAHEIRRLAAVLSAMPQWDLAAALAAETEEYPLLYSGMSAEQCASYGLLREEGVSDARS